MFALSRRLVDGLSIKYILGHEEISPGRKTDPGPAFPLDKMRARLLGSRRNIDEDSEETLDSMTSATRGIVNASLLNARTGPSLLDPLACLPLRRGTSVHIVGVQAGWLRIDSPVKAWVKQEYVDVAAVAELPDQRAAARSA